MLCYIDDLLHICFKIKEDMDDLNLIYQLKEVFGPLERYLGTNFEKVQLEDGRVVWSNNRVDDLKSVIEIFNNLLGLDKTALDNYEDSHRIYSSRFSTELDVTE